jgi:predicted nucleotidyltransferase
MVKTRKEALTQDQLRILATFRKQPFGRLLFKDIKKLSKTRSNNMVQKVLVKFKQLQLVTQETVGDVTAYHLNLSNDITLLYLALIDDQEIRKNEALFRVLRMSAEHMDKYTEFYIMLVFGSYAKGMATEKSDVDVAVIVETEEAKGNVKPALNTARRKSLPPVDFQVFSRTEFLEMLTIDEENVGKEIVRDNFIYYGAAAYYKLLRKVLHETPRHAIFGTR